MAVFLFFRAKYLVLASSLFSFSSSMVCRSSGTSSFSSFSMVFSSALVVETMVSNISAT